MRQRQLQRIDPIHPGTGGPFGSKHKHIFFPVDHFQNRRNLTEREKSVAGSEIKVCGVVLSKAFPVLLYLAKNKNRRILIFDSSGINM